MLFIHGRSCSSPIPQRSVQPHPPRSFSNGETSTLVHTTAMLPCLRCATNRPAAAAVLRVTAASSRLAACTRHGCTIPPCTYANTNLVNSVALHHTYGFKVSISRPLRYRTSPFAAQASPMRKAHIASDISRPELLASPQHILANPLRPCIPVASGSRRKGRAHTKLCYICDCHCHTQ